MASALALMSKMDVNSPVKGVAGVALDTGIEFGVGYGLAQAYHRHSDKWIGRNAPRLVTAIGKLGAVAAQVVTKGRANFIGGALNTVGSAGATAWGMELGFAHARKATGKQPYYLPPGVAPPAGALPVSTIGELPAAGEGRSLSLRELEEFAAMR